MDHGEMRKKRWKLHTSEHREPPRSFIHTQVPKGRAIAILYVHMMDN